MTVDLSDLKQAAAHWRQAIAQNPKNAEAHTNLGNVLRQQGNLLAAVHSFQKALRLDPTNASAHSSLGIALAEQGDSAAAAHHFQQAIAFHPGYAAAHTNLGYVLRTQGRLSESLQSFQAALALNPKSAFVHNGLGLVLMEQGNLEPAAAHFRKAIAFNSNDADPHYNLGLVLKQQDKLEKAVTSFRRAIALRPSHAKALFNLGLALQEQGKSKEAIFYLQQALTLDPKDATAHSCLGIALQEQGNLEEAASHLQQAIALCPSDAETYNNLGNVLWTQSQLEQAIDNYQAAIQLNPDYAEAHASLAQSLLMKGELQVGFTEYEWRWKILPPAPYSQPIWDGSSLEGKTILLCAEGGFGDNIQFVRYAPLVAERGARVLLVCQAALKRLLATLPQVELVLEGDLLPEFQVHASLMSLPRIMQTTLETIPAQIPYLAPPPEHDFNLKLLPDTHLRVGIAWASGYKTAENMTKAINRALFKSYQERSCSLPMFAQLLSTPGISFYSLQIGSNATDISQLEGEYSLQDLSPHITDFADTAALIAQMDLIISVDTAVVHLAGALGKPVWVLLPFVADWRWLQDREDTPWYPTMRLFRQRAPGDWQGVLTQVTQALQLEKNNL